MLKEAKELPRFFFNVRRRLYTFHRNFVWFLLHLLSYFGFDFIIKFLLLSVWHSNWHHRKALHIHHIVPFSHLHIVHTVLTTVFGSLTPFTTNTCFTQISRTNWIHVHKYIWYELERECAYVRECVSLSL